MLIEITKNMFDLVSCFFAVRVFARVPDLRAAVFLVVLVAVFFFACAMIKSCLDISYVYNSTGPIWCQDNGVI